MHLDNIPGHGSTKDYFYKIVKDTRIPHAILLSGGEGHGKLALAIGLAQLLQCQNVTDGKACNQCNSCLKASKYIHPDIHFSFPVIKKDNLKREDTTSKQFMKEWREFLVEMPYGNMSDWLSHLGAVDKRANINVTECNEIAKNLSLKTFEGRYKIQIIWHADYLGKEGNRLLKLIEEPSDDSIIILIINNRNHILNTIKSRCQSLIVPPFSDEDMMSFISSQTSLSKEDQEELVHLASGDIRKTLTHIHDTKINYSEDLVQWMRVCYKSDPEELIDMTSEMAQRGKQDIINFFQYGLHFFREYHQYLSGIPIESLRLTGQEKEILPKMEKIISLNKIRPIEAILTQSISHIGRNLSLKILLMNGSIEINTILRSEVNKFVTS